MVNITLQDALKGSRGMLRMLFGNGLDKEKGLISKSEFGE